MTLNGCGKRPISGALALFSWPTRDKTQKTVDCKASICKEEQDLYQLDRSLSSCLKPFCGLEPHRRSRKENTFSILVFRWERWIHHIRSTPGDWKNWIKKKTPALTNACNES
jgi:hypothetical protein